MSRYCSEDIDAPVDEQVDELSLLDFEDLEYKEGEGLDSLWLYLRDESASLRVSESITSKIGQLAMPCTGRRLLTFPTL
jgi:hypothetical protein